MKQNKSMAALTITILSLVAVGCSSDRRLAEIAARSMEMQARQNARTTEMQQDISAGARLLVEAEAAARQETLGMRRQLQQQHAEIGQQRDSLEAERRQIASQRYVHPIIAAAITHAGILLACALPLVICWQLLRFRSEPADDAVLAEVLLQDLSATNPILLIPEQHLHNIECRSSHDSGALPSLPSNDA